MQPKAARTFTLVLVSCASLSSGCIVKPPGRGFRGTLPPLNDEQVRLRGALSADVSALASIGPRATTRMRRIPDGFTFERDPSALNEAADWVAKRAARSGRRVEEQAYTASGAICKNFVVEIPGATRPEEIVVISAHYDSVPNSPGANDDASGIAALLSLLDSMHGRSFDRTIRFVFFTNEEQPHAYTDQMGSRVYAKACRERGDEIVAMFSLDPIGYYSDREGSQKYPSPLSWYYPSTGNFVGFAGNTANARLMKRAIASFRRHVQFPSEGLAINIKDVERSDHGSFWHYGYPAIIITDTGEFRDPNYHAPSDTHDKVNFDALARVVTGLHGMLVDFATVSSSE